MSLRRLGEDLDLARNTVRTYFREPPEPPKPTPRALRASLLDPYDEDILERLSQECKNAAQIFRELQETESQGPVEAERPLMEERGSIKAV